MEINMATICFKEYFSFIGNNKENYMIMQKSIVGKLILYWNFISMWLLVFLSQKVKEVDE